MDTKEYIDALENVLSKRYSPDMYSLNGYQESAVCLQSSEAGWIIYNGERGNKYNITKCNTVLSACLEFMRRFTHKTEDLSIMETELLNNLRKTA